MIFFYLSPSFILAVLTFSANNTFTFPNSFARTTKACKVGSSISILETPQIPALRKKEEDEPNLPQHSFIFTYSLSISSSQRTNPSLTKNIKKYSEN